MIRSMTGFGAAEHDTAEGRLRAEVRTVNHRFLNTSVKTPAAFDAVERRITDRLRAHLRRGHVTVTLSFERGGEQSEGPLPELDLARAKRRVELLQALKEEFSLEGALQLDHVVRFGDIFRQPRAEEIGLPVSEEEIDAVIDRAAEAVLVMRDAEGARLEADLRERLTALHELLAAVEARAPERLIAARERLRTAVRELIDGEDIDEERVAREIAYLAEKWDIHEEIVRFRSHIDLFVEAIEGDSSEPVGKRLSFLVQEMLREANTIGSKANDGHITGLAVSIKEEIERIREQVENVE